MTKVLIACCADVRALMVAFANFKRTKNPHEHVIAISLLEEKGDALYLEYLHNLHVDCNDPLIVFAWHELYTFLERCIDAYEHAADVVESVVMKNT